MSRSKIALTINARTYEVLCAPGEEAHLQSLGADIDDRIAQLVRRFGQVGESQLLVVASLLLADELFEARNRPPPAAPPPSATASQTQAVAVETLAMRIEAIVTQLKTA